MDHQPLITVYTQGFNSEAFISQCIESVLNQSYENFEYFICNHGSTDRTLEVIQTYAKTDSRIRVMDIPNTARGFYPDYILKHGKGTYFSMLDSDDYVSPDYFETLVRYSEDHDLDMTCCGILYFNNDTPDDMHVLRTVPDDFWFDIKDNSQYFTTIYPFLRTTWGKIVRMRAMEDADYTIYKENAVDFISDDTAFTLANYEQCKRVGCISENLLYYRIHGSSVTAKYNPAMVDNNIRILNQALGILEKIGDHSKKSNDFLYLSYSGSVEESLGKIFSSTLDLREKIIEAGKVINTPYFLELIQRNFLSEDVIGLLQSLHQLS